MFYIQPSTVSAIDIYYDGNCPGNILERKLRYVRSDSDAGSVKHTAGHSSPAFDSGAFTTCAYRTDKLLILLRLARRKMGKGRRGNKERTRDRGTRGILVVS